MGTPPNIRRIRSDDFDSEYKPLVDKLSYSLNEFMDQVIFLLNNRIDFRNLNQELVDVEVNIDGSGNVLDQPSVKLQSINGRVVGVLVINVTNLTNSTNIPTSQPFVDFTINTGVVSILNVKTLLNNNKYRLKLLLIGENV